MGLFNRKPKIVKEIHDEAWGCLVNVRATELLFFRLTPARFTQ